METQPKTKTRKISKPEHVTNNYLNDRYFKKLTFQFRTMNVLNAIIQDNEHYVLVLSADVLGNCLP